MTEFTNWEQYIILFDLRKAQIFERRQYDMTEYRREMEDRVQASPRAVRYQLLTSCLEQDGVDYLTYGIQCMGDWSGHWVQMDAVQDISFQRENVVRLADLFNRCQLSPVHFRDAVLDCVNA